MNEKEKTPQDAGQEGAQAGQEGGCDCIERINRHLQKVGSKARVSTDTILTLDSDTMDTRVGIRWESASTGALLKQGPAQFAAKFCPFCGKAYLTK